MPTTVPVFSQFSSQPMMTTIKTLAESPNLISIPAAYAFNENLDEPPVSESEVLIPSIDFSLLTGSDPEQRSKIIHDLGKACLEWGCFMVMNHDVPESLMRGMIVASEEFFDLNEEDKKEYQAEGKHALDSIRCGTSFDASDKVLFWKDYLKIHVHPKFHSPTKPESFREVSLQYCQMTRRIMLEVLKGISESLGLEQNYVHKAMNLDQGLQVFVANFYPPCPQPELAMGLPPHTDHGLLTFLIQDSHVGGLQLHHNGKWIKVDLTPNTFLVNVGDHLEIMSNGKYKSVLHRVVVNNKSKRISIAVAHGPSMDSIVTPADEMVDEDYPPAYKGKKYGDYLELKRLRPIDKKFGLDSVRI